MSLAAETRRAVDRRPFLRAALRAEVVNYTAAARYLDVDGEIDAVATALRRYAAELPPAETTERETTVRMQSGIGVLDLEGETEGRAEDDGDCGADGARSKSGTGSVSASATDPLLSVGGVAFGDRAGGRTAIVATGDVDPAALATALQRLAVEEVEPAAAAVAEGAMVVVVGRREGATALRTIEDVLEGVADG